MMDDADLNGRMENSLDCNADKKIKPEYGSSLSLF